MGRLSQSLKRRRGATATETVILIVLVAMVVLASIKALSDTLGGKVELANTEVGAVSTENSDAQRRRANAKRAREQERGGQGSAASSKTLGSAQGRSGEGGSSGLADPDGPRVGEPAPGTPGAAPDGGCGGFNPFIIPIGLGMLGLLGYVVMKSQKG